MKSTLTQLLFVFLSSVSFAQQQICTELLANLPADLKADVQKLEGALQTEIKETEATNTAVIEINTAIDNLEDTMNWRERRLWSWLAKLLGGNPEKIAQRNSLKEAKTELEDLLEKDKSQDRAADKKVIDVIDAYFNTYDSEYAKLRALETQLNDLVCDGDKCIRKINTALESVKRTLMWQNNHNLNHQFDNNYGRHAQYLEDSTPFDYNQQLANKSLIQASQESREAQRAMDSFSRAIKKLRNDNSLAYATRNSSSPLDIILDMSLTLPTNHGLGLDFVKSIRLADMENNLNKLKDQVQEVRNSLDSEHEQLKAKLNAVLCEARRLCNAADMDNIDLN